MVADLGLRPELLRRHVARRALTSGAVSPACRCQLGGGGALCALGLLLGVAPGIDVDGTDPGTRRVMHVGNVDTTVFRRLVDAAVPGHVGMQRGISDLLTE